ncbi:EAL domain-containing response regulator [Crenobacter sp. SG2303]|uniref:EAL domain-containing response regulator n=1 Tax=Crenobacter oryzisoli TaxID=3056844 RepID=A0ABT7XT72_9NEIS|nr:EAL domain-containing response regulator [Crenobacter sp. SG2303]MDN0076998.1 EAL domain-containing response regulator [Crenobacter sp. SG2303]
MATDSSSIVVETALIVDDSRVQRQHAADLLRQLGVVVIHEAGDGIQALELLEGLASLPHLILVDLDMPRMDGVEFIQQLARRGVSAALIVLSGRDSPLISAVESMAHVLGMPVLAAWQKPLGKNQLVDVLRHRSGGPLLSQAAPGGRKGAVVVTSEELASAIAARQLIPYYQPKVDLNTGLVKGVEVLARWLHPEKGVIPPSQFIPLAESEGLIHGLTVEVADQAFAQVARWRQHGLSLSVAVNLSPLLLDSPDFVVEAAELLCRYRIPAEQVVWEITESSLAADLGTALGNLARLRLKGCGLSIDDYGTGFSSMQQLSRVPFTELKIDHSFVRGAHRREHLRVILQSALDMASKMRLVTVAEGIETAEDWTLLQGLGCVLGQGYFIARPMPGGVLPAWLKEEGARLYKHVQAVVPPSKEAHSILPD